jgi:hypothetical protein
MSAEAEVLMIWLPQIFEQLRRLPGQSNWFENWRLALNSQLKA